MTCNSRSLLPIGSHARRVMTLACLEMNKYTTAVSLHPVTNSYGGEWHAHTSYCLLLSAFCLANSQPVLCCFCFHELMLAWGTPQKLNSNRRNCPEVVVTRLGLALFFWVSFISRGSSTALFQSAVTNKVIRGSIKKYNTTVGSECDIPHLR